MKDTILEMLERDVRKVMDELMLYKNEAELWKVTDGINNSAGNLALHLTGNLNHFIGAVLGDTGYVRNRDSEFTTKGINRTEMITSLEYTIKTIKQSFDKFSEEDLQNKFPLEKHGKEVTTGHMLLHLLTHLNYHLGQLNYHRRLLAND